MDIFSCEDSVISHVVVCVSCGRYFSVSGSFACPRCGSRDCECPGCGGRVSCSCFLGTVLPPSPSLPPGGVFPERSEPSPGGDFAEAFA